MKTRQNVLTLLVEYLIWGFIWSKNTGFVFSESGKNLVKDMKFEIVYLFYSSWEDQGVKHANVEKWKLSELLGVNKLMNDSVTMLKTQMLSLKEFSQQGAAAGPQRRSERFLVL